MSKTWGNVPTAASVLLPALLLLASCKHADESTIMVDSFAGTPVIREKQGGELVSADPINAVFDQGTFTTTYSVEAGLIGLAGAIDKSDLRFHWSGPNCGRWGAVSTETVPAYLDQLRSIFEWEHPHPPCAVGQDHRDVTVKVLIVHDDEEVMGFPKPFADVTLCSFVGSGTGKGTACTKETYHYLPEELKKAPEHGP